jgi:signal transduction histidine kinase/ligand-binding sensor domain-containing protein
MPASFPSVGAVILGLLLTGAGAAAQSPRIPFVRLSLEQGLSSGTVNGILQDRAGFLWLGTQDGLNRYDGYEFHVYRNDPGTTSSLPANWIADLAEDPSGDLWVATEGGGLAHWHRSTDVFTRYRQDPADPASLPSDQLRVLHVTAAGTLWIGTFQSGLARFAGDGRGFETFRHDPNDPSSLSDDRVRAIHEDRAGNLWVGTLGGLDFVAGGEPRRDPARREEISFVRFRHDREDPSSLTDDRVYAILEDSAGDLWVGTEKGLNRRRDGGFVRIHPDPADPEALADGWVTGLLEDRSGRLWIGTDGGLHVRRPGRDGEKAAFLRYRHDALDLRSLSSDRVLALFQDRGGVLWAGTQSGGVNKWSPLTMSFAQYRSTGSAGAGPAADSVHAFAEDGEGAVYVGSLGGLDVFDPATGRFTHLRPDSPGLASLADCQVMALHFGRDGYLWIGTLGKGLGRLDTETRTLASLRHDPARPESLSNDDVSAIAEDRDGELWVATYRGGLNRLDRTRAAPDGGSFHRLRHDPSRRDGLSDDHLTALAAGTDGSLWVGTYSAGLNRLVAAARRPGDRAQFQQYRHDPGDPASLSSDKVYALRFDPAGHLWVGTQLGLNRLESPEGDRFRHYFERDGLPNDVVWGIECDDEGRLWISTNLGLSRFDPRTRTFKNFNTGHGLQSNEFNFGAHFRSRTGELYFGGVGGMNVFHPDEIVANAAVPAVVPTSFTKLNEPVSLSAPIGEVEAVHLSHLDDLFTFEFASLDFTAPEDNRYRYRLEGLNASWIDLGSRRSVTFTDLAPGRYVLRVQGSNNDGVWNEEGASIRIMVEPPFWGTWWFRLAGAVAGAGVLLAAHRQRLASARRHQQALAEGERAVERERLISRLEAKNEELERFTYTVSHDLKAPLLTIRGFLGYLKKDAAAGKSLNRDIELIENAANKMHVLLDDLLQLSRVGRLDNPPEEVPFGQLVQEALKLTAGYIRDSRVRVDVEPDLGVVVVVKARLVELLQNLIQNAVKYMGDQDAPRVEIGVRREGPRRVFFVRDNGMGIEPQHHAKIFELFQRLDVGSEGTGIGLALAKRIVEVHGGRIWVESEGRGRGSTFCFTLADDEDASSAPD